jgi:hypothetical protein
MKTFTVFALFILLGFDALGQNEAKVIAEIASSTDKIVKGSPFSADAVSESVQVLTDGNRIVRSSTTKMYRNSEGRFRREMQSSAGSLFNTFYTTGEGITILDPIAGRRLMLNDELKTVRMSGLAVAPGAVWTTVPKPGDPANAEKYAALVRAQSAPRAATTARAAQELAVVSGQFSVAGSPMAPIPPLPPIPALAAGFQKFETKTEELGSRDFDGVSAEGKRTTTTIPAGAIGNERPIEIIYDRWYSNDLQLTIFSEHSDPRFGKQTYKLTNLVRAEPDASLFSVPSGYKVLTEPGFVYRIQTPTPPGAAKAPTVVRVTTLKSPDIKDSLPPTKDTDEFSPKRP